ncbi:hypothetical protein DITRI_Ditri12bG0038800 [Diplodiscus trichospermus]
MVLYSQSQWASTHKLIIESDSLKHCQMVKQSSDTVEAEESCCSDHQFGGGLSELVNHSYT